MKRKVIQIAGSTQLISLPRKWAVAHNVKKGAELDVQEDGDTIVISADNKPIFESAEINISDSGAMTHRLLGSYYRSGVDELKVTYNDPKMIELVYDSLNRETMVGFEVLEQGNNYCVMRYVAGEMEEFDSVLRRVFMLLVNMSTECLRMLKERQFDAIQGISFLEKSNNRFTTICRRVLNKSPAFSKQAAVGPSYFIVECLENIADEYKYISQHYSKLASKRPSLSKDTLGGFEKANSMVRIFYEIYYKFDIKKLVELKKLRDEIVEDAHKIFEGKVSHFDAWLTHHAIMLATMVFNMVGPFMVLLVKEKKV